MLRHSILVWAALAGLAGVPSQAFAADGATQSDAQALPVVIASLDKGDTAAARLTAGSVLAGDPRDARMHLLNGLGYHLAAERGEGSAYALAKVGYQTSLRFDPNDFWAHEFLGVADFETRDWRAAQQSFASAVLLRPDDWRAQEGLAASSYYAGDLPMAALAGVRAAKLAPSEPLAQRIAALTCAASGDTGGATRFTRAYEALGGSADLASRVNLMERTAQAATAPPAPAAPAAAGATPPNADSQMLVEVTLILSDDTIDRGEGVNLLQGLQAQFGFNESVSGITGHPASSFERTITGSIAVPQVNYSLNLFNRTRSYYWVLSRPTLTAYLGQESDFFVGHTVSVPVSGVNLGSLQSVDAGTSLKLTPLEIGADKVKFKIEANRSFFDPVSQIQGFSQQISVFKESASATAALNFGQTLILSGLSENVTDSNDNVTPGLSGVPVIGEFFGRHDAETQRTSVLILVTPLAPLETTLPRHLDRDGAVAEVAKLWTKMIDPQSDVGAITGDIGRYYGDKGSAPGLYTGSPAQQSDIALQGPSDKRLLADALGTIGH